ncbi:hypothetical protein BGX28_003865 [Mortierella sp. GBA30]|nr:hypothetical protein BGX28_003865 [Mortierella sp. GBA30]
MQPHLNRSTRSSRSAARSYHRSSKVQSNNLLIERTHAPEEMVAEERLFRTSADAKSAAKLSKRSLSSPSMKQTLRINPHDAPLFAREPKAGRRPFGVVAENPNWRSPQYRPLESQEEACLLSRGGFNPFDGCPTTNKVVQRLPARGGTEISSPNVWSINTLPLSKHERPEILRSSARLDYSMGSAVALHETVADTGPVYLESHEQLRSTVGLDVSVSAQEPEPAQRAMIEEVLQKLFSQSTNTQRHELETALLRIGQSRLQQLGLSSAFVETSANHQDVVGSGLETLIIEVQRSANILEIGQLFDTLYGCEMLQLLDRTSIMRLRTCLCQRSAHDSKSQHRSRIVALEKLLRMRGAKKIDQEEWKIQTRRFRLLLALARGSGMMPNESEYVAFMKSCLKAGHYQDVDLVFHHFMEHYEQHQQQPSEMIYREYIKGLVRQGRMDHAQEVFHSMKHKKVTPSVVIFGVMLDGYGRQMDLQRMSLTLNSLQASGLSPTLEIYTSLIGNYTRAGQLDKAHDVYLQLLERSDLAMDQQSKNVVQNLIRLRGNQGSEPSLLFKKTIMPMNADRLSSEGDTSKRPKLERLNAVISVNHKLKKYTNSMNMPKFIKAFRELGKRGLRPNTITFNILLDALTVGGELEDGLRVLEHMKTTKEGEPDLVTYSTLIRGAVNGGKADLGWTLYDEMRKQSIVPSLRTYVSLIGLVALDPKNKAGRAVVKEHFIAGPQHIRFPVKAHVEDQVGLNFAGILYNQLCNQGLKPNEYIFGGLLDLTVRGGYMQLAQHVYLEMLCKNVEPNTAIMTTLIKGFAIQRDFESGWKVWKNMIDTNIPRNAITYHHLVRLCERSLPNPMMMAEMLDSPSLAETVENSKRSDQSKERKKNKYQSGDKVKNGEDKESLENTTRIPLTIWTEIRDQMQVDRVDWSRVQQFRTKVIDNSIWSPIPVEAGPVVAFTSSAQNLKNDRDSRLDEAQPSHQAHTTDHFMGSAERTSSRPRSCDTQDHLQSKTHVNDGGSSEPVLMIKEVFTGGGDQFEPHRAPLPDMTLKWVDSLKAPLLKKSSAALVEDRASDSSSR